MTSTMTASGNISDANLSPEKNILGWEGFTLTLPRYWTLASFAGNRDKGNLRVADEDGTRIELVWETPKGTPNLERSIANLEKSWEKEAKRKKQPFELVKNPLVVAKTRKQKEQLINFGWKGDLQDPMAAHGWGTGWHCAECGRVVVAHLVGRGRETPAKAQRLATEIFTEMDCHGEGGWNTWSVFGFQVDIPEDFTLRKGKLQTGKIDLEWEMPRPDDWWMMPKWWGRRPERVGVQRLSAANLVLQKENLQSWGERVVPRCHKSYLFKLDKNNSTDDELWFDGKMWQVRQRLQAILWNTIMRRKPQIVRAKVWCDEKDNKLFFAFFDLPPKNIHVQDDVIDSITSHTLV